MMTAMRLWCRVTIFGPDGNELAGCDLEGPGAPDLAAVDAVAGLALLAGRLGFGIALGEVSQAMRELLALAGLGVEVGRQSELPEESLRVQEHQKEVETRDLSI
jgi:hypothetical protein